MKSSSVAPGTDETLAFQTSPSLVLKQVQQRALESVHEPIVLVDCQYHLPLYCFFSNLSQGPEGEGATVGDGTVVGVGATEGEGATVGEGVTEGDGGTEGVEGEGTGVGTTEGVAGLGTGVGGQTGQGGQEGVGTGVTEGVGEGVTEGVCDGVGTTEGVGTTLGVGGIGVGAFPVGGGTGAGMTAGPQRARRALLSMETTT